MTSTSRLSGRRLAWWALLAAGVLLVVLAAEDPAPSITTASLDDDQAQVAWPVARLRARHPDADDGCARTLFGHALPGASTRPLDAVAVAPLSTASVAPAAPPPPVTVLGRMEEGGEQIVFLQVGSQTLRYMAARVGDQVDGDYVVQRLEGRRVVLRHRASGRVSTVHLDDNQ